MQFPVAIYHNNDGYQVVVPDIPALTTTGIDMAEAVSNARTVVINHLYHLVEIDATIPEPSPVSKHLTNPKYAGATWAIVGIDMSRILGETIALDVNLPTRLFKQAVQAHRDTPIDIIIAEALKQYLATHAE